MDVKFELKALQDESRINRDGTVTPMKRADFYLGKFGPFVERFPAEEYTAEALEARVSALQRGIEQLHRG